jgi:hypothetical protein
MLKKKGDKAVLQSSNQTKRAEGKKRTFDDASGGKREDKSFKKAKHAEDASGEKKSGNCYNCNMPGSSLNNM